MSVHRRALAGAVVLALHCVAVAACAPTSSPQVSETDEAPAITAPAHGLVELPACATTGSATGGTALLYPRRALPALVASGTSVELRVRMARSLMPAPGVQRSRALWGWSIRIDARGDHALGVRESDPNAQRPALRYALRVLGVRADDSLSLVYRVRVEIPLGAVPATYDVTVRRPGVTVREALALRVIGQGRQARVVHGGTLERPDLAVDLARWSRGGADLVVVEPGTNDADVEQVGASLIALERASATALLVVPPRALSRPAAWADGVAATGYAYATNGAVRAVGRCLDGRTEPITSAVGGSAGRRDDALTGGVPGRIVDGAEPFRAPLRAPVVGRDAQGQSTLEAGDPDATTEVLVALRRGDRLRCAPSPVRCKTVAIGVSPDPFTAPSDAATGIVVSLAPGPPVALSRVHAERGALRIEPTSVRVAAGQPFELVARAPGGLVSRRVLWALGAPPSADWVYDEEPATEGRRLRHRIRAPGTHELRALAIADDGALASGAATVEVIAAATAACAVSDAAVGRARRGESPFSAPGLLLALVCVCFIGRRRNVGGHGSVSIAHVPSARFVSRVGWRRVGSIRVRHLEHPEHGCRGHCGEPRGAPPV